MIAKTKRFIACTSKCKLPERRAINRIDVVFGVIASSINCGKVSVSERLDKQRERTQMVFLLLMKKDLKRDISILTLPQPHKFLWPGDKIQDKWINIMDAFKRTKSGYREKRLLLSSYYLV